MAGTSETSLPADGLPLVADVARSGGDQRGWQVDFDLPYFVSVADSMDDPVLRSYVQAVEAGSSPDPVPYSPRPRPQGTFVVGGLTLHLPDLANLGEPFEVPLSGGVVRLSFLRRIRNVDRSAVLPGELRPDSGAASFSSVRANFDIDLSATFETNDLSGVATAALASLNTFLERLRFYTGAYWVHPVDKSDVVEFRIWLPSDDQRPRSDPSVHTAPPGGPLRSAGSPPMVDAETDASIRSALTTGQQSPLELEVLLSAQEHVHRNRYRNAVVDAAAAFEIYLAGFLRFHLAANGRSQTQIDAAFLDDSGRYLSVTVLAKRTLRIELGIRFGSTSAYRNWKTNVNDIRNAVIHRGAHPTREEALVAIRDTDRARAKLRELAPPDPGTSPTGAEEGPTTRAAL